jgi:hypothetical protein
MRNRRRPIRSSLAQGPALLPETELVFNLVAESATGEPFRPRPPAPPQAELFTLQPQPANERETR